MTKAELHKESLARLEIRNILRDADCCRNQENRDLLCDKAAALVPKILAAEQPERLRQIQSVREGRK